MLDYFAIFARGGALLWTFQLAALRGDPIGSFIRDCLLEDRAGSKSYDYSPSQGAPYTLKWTLHNGLGLVFVAVYQKALSLMYVDTLLMKIKAEFEVVYKPDVARYDAFEDTFKKVLRECEMKVDMSRRQQLVLKDRKQQNPKNKPSGSRTTPTDMTKEETDEDEDAEHKKLSEGKNPSGDTNGTAPVSSDEDTAFDVSKLKKKGTKGSKAHRAKPHKEKSPAPANKKKVNRVWDETADVKNLDYSVHSNNANAPIETVDFTDASKMEETDDSDVELPEEEDQGDGKKSTGMLSSFFRGISVNVMGSNALTREDIQGALDNMKKKLMERNVAQEIAEKLCESVALNLEGQKLKSFTGVSSAVVSAFGDALERILTPKRSINILGEIEQSKARTKPYVIVFVGVNGVGKSTNLAKIAYWLLQNKHKIMIAACDTFRAGAVEQLRTHCQRLQVPLFEKGYEKDPAKVAFEATREAQLKGCDVLLVDTAGRMQDNEPLMRALSNLINLNEPDLVLFVGEALVGNDAVDQLTKFNQRLADLSTTARPRLIDGIVLTKFDTIDDKVGAACSMVYTSGAPIVFVGCGQTYVDLKRLHVKSVVKSLLK